MHVDENKKFDKRNIGRNIKDGIITKKDYEIYLSKLSDASDKLFDPEDYSVETDDLESKRKEEIQSKKRSIKKKTREKGRS
jgi:hypothetical protein